MAPFDDKYRTIMFSLSITVYEIFADLIKCQKFDLENEEQDQEGEKRNLHHSTGNVRFYINAFQNFSYPATYFDAKEKSYGHTYMDTYRGTGVVTVLKICNADLPKNTK